MALYLMYFWELLYLEEGLYEYLSCILLSFTKTNASM